MAVSDADLAMAIQDGLQVVQNPLLDPVDINLHDAGLAPQQGIEPVGVVAGVPALGAVPLAEAPVGVPTAPVANEPGGGVPAHPDPEEDMPPLVLLEEIGHWHAGGEHAAGGGPEGPGMTSEEIQTALEAVAWYWEHDCDEE